MHAAAGSWAEVWATTCAAMWRWRNMELHDEDFVRPKWPWIDIAKWVQDYSQALDSIGSKVVVAKHCMNVSWLPPANGWTGAAQFGWSCFSSA